MRLYLIMQWPKIICTFNFSYPYYFFYQKIKCHINGLFINVQCDGLTKTGMLSLKLESFKKGYFFIIFKYKIKRISENIMKWWLGTYTVRSCYRLTLIIPKTNNAFFIFYPITKQYFWIFVMVIIFLEFIILMTIYIYNSSFQSKIFFRVLTSIYKNEILNKWLKNYNSI